MAGTLTPEFESEIRRSINPLYVSVKGTSSNERVLLMGEIDRLRAMLGQTAASELRALVPVRASPAICEALRTGSLRDVPSDELCRVRWAAAVACASVGEK